MIKKFENYLNEKISNSIIYFEHLDLCPTYIVKGKKYENNRYKIVHFAYDDEGTNMFALLDLKTKNVLSYSLNGTNEFKKFEELKIEGESYFPMEDLNLVNIVDYLQKYKVPQNNRKGLTFLNMFPKENIFVDTNTDHIYIKYEASKTSNKALLSLCTFLTRYGVKDFEYMERQKMLKINL